MFSRRRMTWRTLPYFVRSVFGSSAFLKPRGGSTLFSPSVFTRAPVSYQPSVLDVFILGRERVIILDVFRPPIGIICYLSLLGLLLRTGSLL